MAHPNEEPNARQQPRALVSLFSGAGIGLMVGILLGLANSPMVGVLAGAVGAGLAAVLGLNDTHFTTAKGLRIGAFGIAVAIAAPAGLYARNHRLLHPTPAMLADRKAEYLALGLEEEEVLDLLREWLATPVAPNGDSSLVRRRLAAAARGAQSLATVAPSTLAPAPQGMVRFSERGVELANCRELVRLGDAMSVEQVVGALDADGARWRTLADRVKTSLSGDDQKRMLLLARDEVCPRQDEPPPPAPSVEQCRQLDVSVADPETEMRGAYTSAGLALLYERLTREISAPGQDDALALMVGVVCRRESAAPG